MPEAKTKRPHRYGTCPVCGRRSILRVSDGKVGPHRKKRAPFEWPPPGNCDGWGQKPSSVEPRE